MELSLIDRRMIEAGAYTRIFEAMREYLGEETAYKVLAEAIDQDSIETGREFAESAPDGPSLAHFASMVEGLVKAEGEPALELADLELSGDTFSYTVKRCRYAEGYGDMGLPPRLAHTLSCRRDHAFAKGYSPNLSLERPCTLAVQSEPCRFVYVWKP